MQAEELKKMEIALVNLAKGMKIISPSSNC